MTLAVDLPFHVYGFVERKFANDGTDAGFEPAVLFGFTVPRNRSVGLNVLLANGACYRNLPPHAWAFNVDAQPAWPIESAQAWDCFGGTAQVLEYAYLRELPVRLRQGGYPGFYLFTLEFGEDGFSRYPAQSKCLHAIELENGRLTLQPNDRIVWHETSFTNKDGDTSWLRRQSEVYGSETDSR